MAPYTPAIIGNVSEMTAAMIQRTKLPTAGTKHSSPMYTSIGRRPNVSAGLADRADPTTVPTRALAMRKPCQNAGLPRF